jgi:hypothetical protein
MERSKLIRAVQENDSTMYVKFLLDRFGAAVTDKVPDFCIVLATRSAVLAFILLCYSSRSLTSLLQELSQLYVLCRAERK